MTEFDALLAAMRAELAALDGGVPDVIAAATAAKLAALDIARTAPQPPRAALEAARGLNALASARVNMLMANVEARLSALTTAQGAPPVLCYSRSGRAPTQLAR